MELPQKPWNRCRFYNSWISTSSSQRDHQLRSEKKLEFNHVKSSFWNGTLMLPLTFVGRCLSSTGTWSWPLAACSQAACPAMWPFCDRQKAAYSAGMLSLIGLGREDDIQGYSVQISSPEGSRGWWQNTTNLYWKLNFFSLFISVLKLVVNTGVPW